MSCSVMSLIKLLKWLTVFATSANRPTVTVTAFNTDSVTVSDSHAVLTAANVCLMPLGLALVSLRHLTVTLCCERFTHTSPTPPRTPGKDI